MSSPAALYDDRPARRRGLFTVAGETSPTYADPAVEDRLALLLDEVCSDERLAGLGDDDVERQVAVARRLEGVATLLTAKALRELRRRSRTTGAASSEWLKSTGRSGKEAAKAARLASSLDALPETAAALAEGRIGAESADAIVQAVRGLSLGSPSEVEGQLLPVAEAAPPEELRRQVRACEQAADGDALLRDEKRQHVKRRLSVAQAEDGMWDVHGRLTAETGSMLRTWLDAFDTPDAAGTPPEMQRRPEQRLADALDLGVAAALDAGATPQNGGVARPHLSVLVDVDTFDADLTDPHDPTRAITSDHPLWADLAAGEDDWGGVLSPQAVRRLCCDAGVSRIVMKGDSVVLDLGRTTRDWSAGQRRAARARDRHCRGPYCSRPIGWTELHHLQWWRHDGRTDLDNALSLCRSCHRLVHEQGWTADLDPITAAVTWTSPDRRRTVVVHPRPPA